MTTLLDARRPKEIEGIRELLAAYNLSPELADDPKFDLLACLKVCRMVACVRAAMRPSIWQPAWYR
jgi:hypothetical protein